MGLLDVQVERVRNIGLMFIKIVCHANDLCLSDRFLRSQHVVLAGRIVERM